MIHTGPFTVRWLDGREEELAIPALPEDDIADAWADHRERGAIGLIDGTNCWRDHAYTEAALASIGLHVGARVRHRRHPALTGVVRGFEYQSQGRLSAMPLKVYWDQPNASDLLGWFAIYPPPESLEALEMVPV